MISSSIAGNRIEPAEGKKPCLPKWLTHTEAVYIYKG